MSAVISQRSPQHLLWPLSGDSAKQQRVREKIREENWSWTPWNGLFHDKICYSVYFSEAIIAGCLWEWPFLGKGRRKFWTPCGTLPALISLIVINTEGYWDQLFTQGPAWFCRNPFPLWHIWSVGRGWMLVADLLTVSQIQAGLTSSDSQGNHVPSFFPKVARGTARADGRPQLQPFRAGSVEECGSIKTQPSPWDNWRRQ